MTVIHIMLRTAFVPFLQTYLLNCDFVQNKKYENGETLFFLQEMRLNDATNMAADILVWFWVVPSSKCFPAYTVLTNQLGNKRQKKGNNIRNMIFIYVIDNLRKQQLQGLHLDKCK